MKKIEKSIIKQLTKSNASKLMSEYSKSARKYVKQPKLTGNFWTNEKNVLKSMASQIKATPKIMKDAYKSPIVKKEVDTTADVGSYIFPYGKAFKAAKKTVKGISSASKLMKRGK